jgi:hypothetical protein
VADEPSYDLLLEEIDSDHVAFQIRMDRATSQEADPDLTPDDELPTRRLFEILGQQELIVYPLNTFPRYNFLGQKYLRIRSLSVDLPSDSELPRDQASADEFLRTHLPQGFIRDPIFGLGVVKEMWPMITAVEELPAILDIKIRDGVPTHIDGATLLMLRDEYEELRLAFQRIARNYQAESLADRLILAHNSIPHRLRPSDFAEESKPYKSGTVFKLLGGNRAKDIRLKGRDRKGLVSAVTANANAIAESDPRQFVQLQKDIEVVSLDRLISDFTHLLKRNCTEARWQKLFELNPFILTMVFGYPVVLVASGAWVGGWTITGQGTKIADFLMKNESTHNAALVEIKTPQTELFGIEFRRGVWTPSKDVIGATVQVLDQRLKFTTNLTTLKHNSSESALQSYSVDCVVVVGRTPSTDDKKASFELFRSQFRDVRLITFDELLGKLHLLRELLAGERYEAPEEEIGTDLFADIIGEGNNSDANDAFDPDDHL